MKILQILPDGTFSNPYVMLCDEHNRLYINSQGYPTIDPIAVRFIKYGKRAWESSQLAYMTKRR